MRVILADIDIDRCRIEAENLESIFGTGTKAEYLDLGDKRSIKGFTDVFLSSNDRLDILVNNAGVMNPPFLRTSQGHEPHWGINHLGHFSLTVLLLKALINTEGSRVVTQSSIVHDSADIDFTDIDSERRYRPWQAYKQSKLATLLFSSELQRRLDNHHLNDPISVACHPGLVNTPLYRNGRSLGLLLRPFMHSIGDGAAPCIIACTGNDVKGGDFYGPEGWRGFRGKPVKVEPLGRGADARLATRVWDLSKTMTGLDPDIVLSQQSKTNH